MEQEHDQDFVSRYTKLEIPKFEPSIPNYLLDATVDPERRYLVLTVSKIEQQFTWVINALLAGNLIHLDLDRRVQNIEDWKNNFTPKWALLSAAGLMIFSAALTVLLQKVMGVKP